MPEIRWNLLDDEGPSQADKESYFAVILQAFRVYCEREKVRHGLWKQYPAEDQMRQIKIKSERILYALQGKEKFSPEEHAMMLEELDDIINYAVFSSRIINEGSLKQEEAKPCFALGHTSVGPVTCRLEQGHSGPHKAWEFANKTGNTQSWPQEEEQQHGVHGV